MKYSSINLEKKLGLFNDHWSPKIIAEMNSYQFKLAKIKGEFIWHEHFDTDEVFFVIEGELDIIFRDGVVNLKEGEMFVIPKGKEHKPVAKKECKIMLVEPRGTISTSDHENSHTKESENWI